VPSRRWPGRPLALLAGVCWLTLVVAPVASAQSVGYAASLYAVRGTYPTARVDSVYVFNEVDVSGGPVRVAVTVPFLKIETTPTTANADGTDVLVGTNTGIGDPLARLDFRVVNDRQRVLHVALVGAVKLPVVDVSSGRGTGEVDYAVGATAFRAVYRTSLMADVLFWKYGDPAGIDFTDTWSYSLGVAQVLGSGKWSAVASFGGFSTGVGGLPPPLALNLGVLTLVGRHQSVAVTASFGLNESSSDFSVGTSWRISR
jgi:Putative MetA-pathway of phenol degradation